MNFLYHVQNLGWTCDGTFKSTSRTREDSQCFEIVPDKLMLITNSIEEENQSFSYNFKTKQEINFVDTLRKLKVGTLVRLCEEEFEDGVFENYGIACVSCEYDEEIPPPAAVTSFLHTLRSCAKKGSMTAVYCGWDLSRCGMLCALHLMEVHGFDVEGACGWLRLKCPGIELGSDIVGYLQFVGRGGEQSSPSQGLPPLTDGAAIRRGVFLAWNGPEQRVQRHRVEGRARPESSYSYRPTGTLAVAGDEESAAAVLDRHGTALGPQIGPQCH
jgi:hypothetical protein